MSSEIVPALDVISETAESDTITAAGEDSNALGIIRRPRENRRAFDLLGLRSALISRIKVDLIGGNHHMRHFVAPRKGHQSVTQFDPNPASLKSILEEMKEPSTLLLRGCDQLLHQSDFPFEKFKTLTALEISGVTILGTLHIKAISEMAQLQTLNLSHLLIETLPEGFFYGLNQLRLLNLRGCSKLRHLPSTEPMELLEVLDLSHCTALRKLEDSGVYNQRLKMLDLSCALPYAPRIRCASGGFTHLFLRDAEVVELDVWGLRTLKVLDLSGAQDVIDIHLLHHCFRLEALDISRTGIWCIDFISDMVGLRYLILRECTRLVELPAMGKLENLEVLDMSGCETLGDLPVDLRSLRGLKELNLSGCCCLVELREGLFDQMSFLEKLDLSNTNIHHLPSFSNLTNLQTLNISHSPVEEVPDLSYILNFKDFFFVDCHRLKGVPAGLQTLTNLNTLEVTPPRSGEIDFIEERISKPSEFHLVSTFFNKSAFDKFKQNIGEIVGLISKIHENLKPSTLDTTSAPTTNTAISATNSETFACTTNADFSATNVVACDISSQTFSRQCRTILADLEYIRDNIDLLESYRSNTSVVELLNDFMNVSHNLSISDLSELLRAVVKLKLLVPPKQVRPVEKNERRNKKKKKLLRTRSMDKEEDVNMNTPEMQNLSRSYDSLTDTQRNCLLYFAVFPHSNPPLQIKERILVQLLYAEGFIHPQHEEIMSASTETDAASNDAIRVESPNTFEEIGRKTLMVLKEKGFIERPMRGATYKKPYALSMKYHVHSFVKARAKAKGLFDFNDKNGNLNSHFCLLISQDNYRSSCKLWPNYTNPFENVESFNTVRSLLNVNEPRVDIKAEWFSKMRNLYVLHLGRSDIDNKEEPNEVVDLNFLEELHNMKQLRLLSLEGFSTIKKLPKSVCKLTSLKILNLRECSYLEELPACIGSLKNLTHLDLTDCHILYKLPKGLRFLSKLEVLKGFVITYHVGGRQHRNACTLRELLNLEKLRKLNLVVNTEKFPDIKDLQVFKEMQNLCNLKITWEKNYSKDQASQDQDVVGPKELRQSRWKQLKCWEQQTRQHETEEPSTSNPFLNLRKLVMRCFPLKTPPTWLHPSGLQRLEKLYLLGGELQSLVEDTSSYYRWNVKRLCLRHLKNLDIKWTDIRVLRHVFSKMTHCDKFGCGTCNEDV